MKRMLKTRTVLLSSILLLVGTAALAAESAGKDHACGHGAGRFFEKLDKDGDGKVTLAEIPEPMRDRLAKADVNHDGVLTKDELTAAHEARHAEMQKKMDTNGDGKVSDEERAAARAKFAEERFAESDKNKDGYLTADEVGSKKWSFIAVADTNKDGKVTKAEIDTAMQNGTLEPPHHHGHRHQDGGKDEGNH